MERTVVQVLCDICWEANFAEIEATHKCEATFDKVEYKADFCESHWLAMKLSEFTRFPKINVGRQSPRSSGGGYVVRGIVEDCPFCDGKYAKGSGMSLHVKSKHNELWPNWREQKATS
jgi:hypothetical protein